MIWLINNQFTCKVSIYFVFFFLSGGLHILLVENIYINVWEINIFTFDVKYDILFFLV